jgi:hypothetical protein
MSAISSRSYILNLSVGMMFHSIGNNREKVPIIPYNRKKASRKLRDCRVAAGLRYNEHMAIRQSPAPQRPTRDVRPARGQAAVIDMRLQKNAGTQPRPPVQPQPPAIPPAPAQTPALKLIFALVMLPAALVLVASQIMVGQIIVIIFGLAILLTRRSATYLFAAAGLMLLAVLALQLFGQPNLASNATIYIYELLVLAVIALLLEEGVS